MFESRRELAKIGKPVDRTEWQMTPPTVNAYYDPQMNDINFPAGVLQPPLFDPKLDDAPNYGNTGATIGHELTHGFDDEGRQFDAKGNLKDWWTKNDAAEFEKRANCVSDQYSQYTVVDDIKINGKLTLGEDVADLGGTLLAYLAWKRRHQGSESAADRRLHARPALLHRNGAVGLRRRAPGEQARERHHQSAFARTNTASTAWCPTCRSSGRRSPARSASRWCAPPLAKSGEGFVAHASACRVHTHVNACFYTTPACRLRICCRFCENADRAITMFAPASCAFCFSSPCT